MSDTIIESIPEPVCGLVVFSCCCIKPASHVAAGDEVHACDPETCGGSWTGTLEDDTMVPRTFPNPSLRR